MLLKQSCNLGVVGDVVLSDRVAAEAAGAVQCHSLAHLVQCLTTVVGRVHEGSISDLHCCPLGGLHTKLRTADTASCVTPPYVVETSSDAG